MVLCIKCHNPITKLPAWLSRVKVGFVCDSCKTRPASQQSHARKVVPPPETTELDLDDTLLGAPGLDDMVGEIEEAAADEVAIAEEPVLAVVSMEETSVAAEPAAEPEPKPEPTEKAPKKRKAEKPEVSLPEVVVPDDAPHTLLAKKLLQVLAHEEPDEQPKTKKAGERKPKPEPKKPVAKAAPEPKARKAKTEPASEPKAKEAKAETVAQPKTAAVGKKPKAEPTAEPKSKKAKAEPAPEPKTKKAVEKKVEPVPAAAPKSKKAAGKKA